MGTNTNTNTNETDEEFFRNNDLDILLKHLNHPWFIYPNSIMSEYNDYTLYKKETIRLEQFLNNFINNLENNYYMGSKILLPIIIGSTMESTFEMNNNLKPRNIFQYQQLFPNYINNFIKNNPMYKYIEIIIISPDSIFTNDNYILMFAKLSGYYFEKINNCKYTCIENSHVINVNIFNCPMVTVEKRSNIIKRNEIILSECKKNNIECNISTFVQSKLDLFLINKIYEHIEKIFSYSNDTNYSINIIINSWVSFKNLYGYSENYNMFPELLTLASDYNIIATEWNYQEENFITSIKSNYHFGNKSFKFNKIIYINYKSIQSNQLNQPNEYNDPNQFIKQTTGINFENPQSNLDNIYQIDFSENFNLAIAIL